MGVSIRTICCKLGPTPEQAVKIESTLDAFAHACNRIADVCRHLDTTNKVMVQRECYSAIRAEFDLSANLTIRAIARVCASLKDGKWDSTFDPTSIDYDARIFSFREADWTLSLTLLDSRQRLATRLGDFQRDALKGQHPTSATLVKRPDGGYYLHVQVKEQVLDPIPIRDVLGVDLGIAQVATDSDGTAYSGKPVEKVRRKHNLQRKRLQRRNTKGARKKLKRIAGKEAGFRRHENHVISRRIIDTAKRTGRAIALEELKGIRDRVRARGGEARNRLSGWAFHQLRSFIEYKASREGVPVLTVDPRNTSRTCSACGHCERANRQTQERFCCKQCGNSLNADWNAARNIRSLALGIRNVPTELAG